MKIDKNKVIPPLSRLIREGTLGDCIKCKSSQVRKYFTNTIFEFGPKIGCIQKECINYYKK